jgi:hypothetical protein
VVRLGAPWFLIARDTITTLGKQFTASLYKTFVGVEAWDSFGGYVRVFDSAGYLSYVADEQGDVVRIVRDELHRPVGLFIGSAAYVHYVYGDDGKLLTKYFVNRSTNTIFYEVDRSLLGHENSYRPGRRVAEAILPGHGTVIEWDADLGPGAGNGYIVASLEGQPYALIPTQQITNPLYENTKPVRRIINLFGDSDDPLLRERVEFNEESIVLAMRTGGEMPYATEHYAGFAFPRYWGAASAGGSSTSSSSASEMTHSMAASSDGSGLTVSDGSTACCYWSNITVTTDSEQRIVEAGFDQWMHDPGPSGVRPGGHSTDGGGGPTDGKPVCEDERHIKVDCNCPGPDGAIDHYCPCTKPGDPTCGTYPNCIPANADSDFWRPPGYTKAHSRMIEMLGRTRCKTFLHNAGVKEADLPSAFEKVKFFEGSNCMYKGDDQCDGHPLRSAWTPLPTDGLFAVGICKVDSDTNINALTMLHEAGHTFGALDENSYGYELCRACIDVSQIKICEDVFPRTN